jgi:hypothetical protein
MPPSEPALFHTKRFGKLLRVICFFCGHYWTGHGSDHTSNPKICTLWRHCHFCGLKNVWKSSTPEWKDENGWHRAGGKPDVPENKSPCEHNRDPVETLQEQLAMVSRLSNDSDSFAVKCPACGGLIDIPPAVERDTRPEWSLPGHHLNAIQVVCHCGYSRSFLYPMRLEHQ